MILLISCKDDLPTGAQFRIKKVTMQGDQQYLTDTYYYSGNGRLSSMDKAYSDRRKTSNYDLYYKTVFRYDARGRLILMEKQPDGTGHGTIYPGSYTYQYDANGNISLIKYRIDSPDANDNRLAKETISYQYGSNRQPIRVTDFNDVFGDGFIYEYSYKDGNVAAIKKTKVTYSGETELVSTRTYQFDDKPNPFYGLFTGLPDPDTFNGYTFKQNSFYQSNTFNRNNIIFAQYDYEYDSYGRLTKIITPGPGKVITAFEYEMY
ncbi:MAG: hypothetical protein BGO59_11645 [Spirosoma sp. 48-14]|nr:MAG: hypothetical protein BGO59_11645 [Spirosoma sp. 48-14]